MSFKEDNTFRICNHHPETCNCMDSEEITIKSEKPKQRGIFEFAPITQEIAEKLDSMTYYHIVYHGGSKDLLLGHQIESQMSNKDIYEILLPLSLPEITDEMIKIRFPDRNESYRLDQNVGRQEGAKWMRDEILSAQPFKGKIYFI